MQIMDCQYVATQRGGVALVFEGHRYNKVRDGKDGTVYWRCSRDRQCPGRAVTVHSRIKKANNKHNHSPDNGVTSTKPMLNSNTLLSTSGSNHQNVLFDAILRHSSNHHNSSSTKQQHNLTEAAMALLGANSSMMNNLNAAVAVAALLQKQQHTKHLFNNSNKLSPQLHSKTGEYLTNNLNDKLISQLNDGCNKDSQFGDNLLSTGSTNYLSNASSSSASSSPLISLCSGQASFQNNRNTTFNHSNKLDLYNQFNSTTNHASNQLNSQYPYIDHMDQFKNNHKNTIQNNVNSSADKQANTKLNNGSSHNLSNSLTYLNNLNNYNNLSGLANRFAQQPDWFSSMNNQLSPLNQITNNGQLNQLFAQFELERLSRLNDGQSNYLPNGNEISHKKFKSNRHDEKEIKLNGLVRKANEDQVNEKMNNLKEELLNDENRKSAMRNGVTIEVDEEISQDDQNIESNGKSTNDLIKLGRLLNNNPSTIFDTLNQLSLTNPQMASALAISLLGQFEQHNTNIPNEADATHSKQPNSSKETNSSEIQQTNLQTGDHTPTQPDQTTEKNIDYFSDSDEEQEPLNMAVRNSGQLVRKLRQLMKNLNYVPEPLQAYIVPSCDAHQSEYIAECDERRKFITNFTGSCGTAIITHEESLLWTDGRYFEQAERQLDSSWILMKESQPNVPSQSEYLSKSLSSGSKVGVDAKLFSFSSFKDLNNVLNNSGIELVPMMDNLVDLLWTDKPDRPLGAIEPLDLKFAGLSWQQKVQDARQSMQQKDATILVLTALDDTAWLFNLRGSDVPFNPVFFVYTILTQESIYLFVEEEQLSSSARKHLGIENSNKQLTNKLADDSMTDSPLNSDEYRVHIKSYNSIFETFKDLLNSHAGKVWISKQSSYALVSLVPETRRIHSPNPVVLKKLVKNDTEIVGMRNAHIKDAVAICEFFAWLEEEIPKGTQTELSAAMKLYEMRKEQCDFIQNSFDTISSSGPNGAVIHYKPTETTNRSLNVEEIYLCDSGAQYLDGTTDVTRAMHFGTPSEFERNAFTRVVKGHINLANCIFPVGCKGHSLDILARKALWEFGLDYLHGTGHGVGCYLNVHEGPIHIGPRSRPDDPGLAEGMILSNEPGYYEKDKFGIRIESLVLVRKKETPYNFNNKGFLCFDTITLVPIQTKLLEPSLLTLDEIEWLDNYHQACREIVGDALKKQGKTAGYKWLMKETEPLG